MSDEAKTLCRRGALSAAALVLTLLLFRALLPWAALGLLAWWLWARLSR